MAVFIAGYVLFSVWKILRDALDLLMDHEISDAERQLTTELVLKHPQIQGMHDLRTRRSVTTVFIQLHLELDAAFTKQQSHDVSDQVNQEIHSLFDEAEVIIHQDPIIVGN
jgi:ferrous-iron efflux pump FieF